MYGPNFGTSFPDWIASIAQRVFGQGPTGSPTPKLVRIKSRG
jgi:hypothetical protein